MEYSKLLQPFFLPSASHQVTRHPRILSALAAAFALLWILLPVTYSESLASEQQGESQPKESPGPTAETQAKKVDLPSAIASRNWREVERAGEDAIRDLLAVVQNRSSDEIVRKEAIKLLGRISGGRQAVPAMLEILTNPKEADHFRWHAAKALGKIGDPQAIKALLVVFSNGKENNSLRSRVAWALGNLRSQEAMEPLIKEMLSSGADSLVRQSAAEALGDIQNPRAIEPLIRALRFNDEALQQGAALALGKISSRQAVEPLIRLLRTSSSTKIVLPVVASALGEIGDPRAIPLSSRSSEASPLQHGFMPRRLWRNCNGAPGPKTSVCYFCLQPGAGTTSFNSVFWPRLSWSMAFPMSPQKYGPQPQRA